MRNLRPAARTLVNSGRFRGVPRWRGACPLLAALLEREAKVDPSFDRRGLQAQGFLVLGKGLVGPAGPRPDQRR